MIATDYDTFVNRYKNQTTGRVRVDEIPDHGIPDTQSPKFIGKRLISTTWKGKHIRFDKKRRQNKCSICNQLGHNRRTCTMAHQATTTIQKYTRRMICLRKMRTALSLYEEIHKLPRDTATLDQVMCFGFDLYDEHRENTRRTGKTGGSAQQCTQIDDPVIHVVSKL